MKFERIGSHVRLIDVRNKDLAVTNLLGVNVAKKFMPSVANTSGVDLSKYKIIKRNQFAANVMHVGRDARLPVALYDEVRLSIVSPAYMTFEVIDEAELLPEYLMLQFSRTELDRLSWYYCDSSVRGGLEWDRLCDIEIPVPSINEQHKYVSLYRSLISNQKTYEESLLHLQFICNIYLETLTDKKLLQSIGSIIESVDRRNVDGQVKNLLGVNIKKRFMPSKANVPESSLSNYKIISNGIFAANIMHVGRDEMLPVSLYQSDIKAIVSPAYKTFKVKQDVEVLPEFLMLWFHRTEFDRLAWFYCDSSVRGGLDWDRFLEIEVPIPDKDIQEAIVTIYHTLQTRKNINEQLKNSLKLLSPVLMKGISDKCNRNPVPKPAATGPAQLTLSFA
ncbi:restriction endonuclease subunit S [Hymenobacter siberiensis]|uniref:restriction endonuclease subunit S n=1 Tax=Hymenobacter siberiensis TaxID=2848396 RepID=UPI001D0158DD|nr:restriction endonuclease subunit S [Hymenobacter siberiensis]